MITSTQTNGNGISDSGWSSGGKDITMTTKVDDFRGDLVPFSKIFFSCSRFFYGFQFFLGIWRFPCFGYGQEGMQWRVTGFDTSQFLFPSTCMPKMFAKTVTKFSVYVNLYAQPTVILFVPKYFSRCQSGQAGRLYADLKVPGKPSDLRALLPTNLPMYWPPFSRTRLIRTHKRYRPLGGIPLYVVSIPN